MKLDRLAQDVGAVVRPQHLLLNAKAFAGVVAALDCDFGRIERTDGIVPSS
jgi:hypothetical protein